MSLHNKCLDYGKPSLGDECYTPFYAVEPLLEFIPKDKIIWCPFDEEWSAYYQILKEHGYNVIRSSLRDGQDFFQYCPEHWDILVSNPPFSKANEVLERAFSFLKPFALLLPVRNLQGKKRYQIYQNQLQLLCFDGRIDFHAPKNMQETIKGVRFGSAYFCRDLLPTKLEFRQLDKYDRPLISHTNRGDEQWE